MCCTFIGLYNRYLSTGRVHALVLERLFESLVALRRDLAWGFADVLHLRTHSHLDKSIENSPHPLSPADSEALAALRTNILKKTARQDGRLCVDFLT